MDITSSDFKIINNEAGSAGGAIYNDRGTVTIARGNGNVLNVSLAGNKSRSGGAIFSSGGSLSVIGAVFSNNSATENGGGIFADSVSPFTVSQSYFYNNSARDGGAIYNQDLPLSVVASTFANNASTAIGSAITNYAKNTVSNLDILNSTFLAVTNRNAAVDIDTDIATVSFSTLVSTQLHGLLSDGINMSNNIIVDSVCGGGFADGGGNLIFKSPRCPGNDAGDPQLSSPFLGRNGGPTPTIAITSANSPAVGAIKFGNCRMGQTVITSDQRGATRPSAKGGNCTVGAYEYNATNVPPDTVPPGVP